MDNNAIGALVLGLPEVMAWPQLAQLFKRVFAQPNEVWSWPLLACQAVGGNPLVATPAAAALLCSMLSITLVDDMLDEDPRGLYHLQGQARTANMALAIQAAGMRLIAAAPLPAEQRVAVMGSLAELALATAYGQALAEDSPGSEPDYWKMVRAKSGPYYEAAVYIGALLGQALPETAERLRRFGALSGEVVQLQDDLKDAFHTPANPDWKQPHNNLLMLYALTAAHPEREQFMALLPHSDQPAALHSAQQILIHSGAVSYCAYHIARRFQAARDFLAQMALADRAPLSNVLARQIQPLQSLLLSLQLGGIPELNAL